jgi:RecA/RadA recombinase
MEDEMWMNEELLTERPVVKKAGLTWRPVDLAAVLESGYEPPRPSVCLVAGSEFGLFYSGRINGLFGDSGGGKTWVALHAIKEAIEAGNDAVLVDYEDHPAAAVSRLEAIGVSRKALLKHLIYIQPQERWNAVAEKNLVEGLAGRRIAIAVIDSTGEGMALDGVNPNADDEVARWFRGAARTLAAMGAAVVLIDHVPKMQAGSRNTDFASGSQRKRAAINGAAYYLEVVVAPSRDTDGKFKLITRKCRFGWRKHGTIACEVEMKNREDNSIEFTISQPDKREVSSFRPTWTMQKLSEWLEKMGQPVSWRAAREAPVGKSGGKADRNTVDAALACLRDDGYVSWPKGKNLEHVSPYVAENDPKNPERKIVVGGSDEPF